MSPTASPAIRASLRGAEPSPEQWLAIQHDPVPVAIIAGAGAGKTAIMAARIVWMVEQQMYRPSQILGLTFTNKAMLELEERIHQAFEALDPSPGEYPLIATYNSFADGLVREHGVRLGIDPQVGLLSDAQSWQLLLDEFGNLPPFEAIESRAMATIVRNALGLADACANHLVTPERIIEEDRRIVDEKERFDNDIVLASRQRIELSRVVRAYLDAKRRVGRIDFGDQVTQAVEILERFEEVAANLQHRYPALLLDEYQDTNVAQRRLLQNLAPTGHNVTAVGDARQNIFQWRGSTLFNLIDFPKVHFLRAGATPHSYLSLSQNFRSGGRILSVANRIIDKVPAERRPGEPLVPAEFNGEGFVGVNLLADQKEEADFIAQTILETKGKPAMPGREASGWSDFAILVRRRAHIPMLFNALHERDIPVEVVGLSGLLQVPEVVDCIAWLRVLSDPGPKANRWLARILLGPRFRIHYRDLALLSNWAMLHNLELSTGKKKLPDAVDHIVEHETDYEPGEVAFSLVESLDHLDEIASLPSEAKRRLEVAITMIHDLRPLASGSLLELLQGIMATIGLVESVDASPRADREAAKANITNFLGVIANFSPLIGEPSLDALLAYLDAAEDVDETLDLATPATSDSVKLMTVHQAKGLEFEVVFVPGVAARTNDNGESVYSIFPDVRVSNPMTSYANLPPTVREDAKHLPDPWSIGKNDERVPKKKSAFKKELTDRAIEDERRLFYVAITRAKQRLYVTAAWWYERQREAKGPSLFFLEVADAPETESVGEAELPQFNPLQLKLAEQAVWPPVPNHIEVDNLLGGAYPEVLEGLIAGTTSSADLLARLGDEERQHADLLLEAHRRSMQLLAPTLDAPSRGPSPQSSSISVTQAVGLASGRLSFSGLSRPLPSRPTTARRIGTEIHRWIEELARGLSGLADEEALDAPSAHVEASQINDLKQKFQELGFADRPVARLDTGEPMAEVPFVLKLGDKLVRGRIDAVYEDGPDLEIVDFKTGNEAELPDVDQLAIYAGALFRMGLVAGENIKLTYCHLALGRLDTRSMTREEAQAALARLESSLTAS